MLLLFGAERPWVAGLAQALRREGEQVQLRPAETLADMRQTRAAVAELRPRAAVMLQAAATAKDPEAAFRVNTEAPMNLAMAALEFGVTPVLRVPSGVAAGLRRPPAEFDPIPGLSPAADSLLRGERFLLRASPQALILRCGPILDPAEVRARLRQGVVASPDRLVCPLSVDQLAQALSRALARGLRGHLHPLSEAQPPISELALWQELAAAYGDPAPRAGASPPSHAALRTERSEELGPLGSWRAALLPPPPEPESEPELQPEPQPELRAEPKLELQAASRTVSKAGASSGSQIAPIPGTRSGEEAQEQPGLQSASRSDQSQVQPVLRTSTAGAAAAGVEEAAVSGACGAVRCCRLAEGSAARAHAGAWLLRVVAGKLWVERGEADHILKPGGSLRLRPGERLELHARGPVAWIELDDPSPPEA